MIHGGARIDDVTLPIQEKAKPVPASRISLISFASSSYRAHEARHGVAPLRQRVTGYPLPCWTGHGRRGLHRRAEERTVVRCLSPCVAGGIALSDTSCTQQPLAIQSRRGNAYHWYPFCSCAQTTRRPACCGSSPPAREILRREGEGLCRHPHAHRNHGARPCSGELLGSLVWR
jgi:hypothetical protein